MVDLKNYRCEGEALLRAGLAAGLTADTVTRIGYMHEHLGGIILIQFFKGKHVVAAYLETSPTANTEFFIN